MKDVFNAFLLKGSNLVGNYDIPAIPCSACLPERVLPFSKAISCKDKDQWVHFYEHDSQFTRLWNYPHRYSKILARYKGIISPDYSVYVNMPRAMQIWNVYRNRALGAWLASEGIEVIPNIRWGGRRTFDFCFDGVEIGKTVAIGTHGCIKKRGDRAIFKAGFYEMLRVLKPSCIIVYGALLPFIENECQRRNIKLVSFKSQYAITH